MIKKLLLDNRKIYINVLTCSNQVDLYIQGCFKDYNFVETKIKSYCLNKDFKKEIYEIKNKIYSLFWAIHGAVVDELLASGSLSHSLMKLSCVNEDKYLNWKYRVKLCHRFQHQQHFQILFKKKKKKITLNSLFSMELMAPILYAPLM